MKLIVGLGNPGSQYEKTRHNAGFMVVDRLATRHASAVVARSRFSGLAIETEITSARAPGVARAILLKPMTYMNRSGQAVAEAARFYKLDPMNDILVLVDEVYLDCGVIRLGPQGGTAGHNGLADVQRALGTENYARCRIGVGPRDPQIPQADFVLGRFTEEQLAKAEPAFDRAREAAELWALEGITPAMNKFNSPDKPPRPKPTRPPGEGAPARPSINDAASGENASSN